MINIGLPKSLRWINGRAVGYAPAYIYKKQDKIKERYIKIHKRIGKPMADESRAEIIEYLFSKWIKN